MVVAGAVVVNVLVAVAVAAAVTVAFAVAIQVAVAVEVSIAVTVAVTVAVAVVPLLTLRLFMSVMFCFTCHRTPAFRPNRTFVHTSQCRRGVGMRRVALS